jgi:hypothetical protein
MKYSFFHVAIFLCLPLFSGCQKKEEIFVSPTGDDVNAGTRQAPLASLQAAKDKAAQLLISDLTKDITIWLDEGNYALADPILFRPEDSGKDRFLIRYLALPDKQPVISGAIRLTGWEQGADGLWSAKLFGQLPYGKGPRELFIDGKRSLRARHPNTGFLRVAEVGEDRRTNFYFEAGDFPIPAQPRQVELTVLHDWSISRIAVDTILVERNWLKAIDSIGARSPSFFTLDNWERNPRYCLENAREFIDMEYEWCFNSNEQRIFLKLPEGLHPDALQVEVPVSEGLLIFDGTEGRPVSNLQFRGITFRYSKWSIPAKGYAGVQACHFDAFVKGQGWGVVPAAVGGKWMADVVFEGCTFEHLGGSGLWMGTGSTENLVKNCTFSDISGNGIMIGEGRDREVNGQPWWQSATDQVAHGNTIENCTITQCGQQFFGAVGIWCGLTANTTIRENELFHLPYTGISIGWMWSPEPTPCRQNAIEGNHIHNIMEILSDGGGIYMLGLQPGSRLVRNHIHDVKINAGRAESNGMFLDEGTTDVVVEGNLIYNIAKSPLRFHKATTNLVKDNVLACGKGQPPIRYNNTKEADITKVDNVVLMQENSRDKDRLEDIIKQWPE